MAALLSACHGPDAAILRPVTQLSPGQTKAGVFSIMGQPTSSMSPGGGVEILRYFFHQPRGLMKSTLTTEYLVHLVNGRVEAYGTPRELKPADPVVILSNDKTVNVNIKTDGHTNAVAPLEPRLNINAN
jgi:hypothetical protein